MIKTRRARGETDGKASRLAEIKVFNFVVLGVYTMKGQKMDTTELSIQFGPLLIRLGVTIMHAWRSLRRW